MTSLEGENSQRLIASAYFLLLAEEVVLTCEVVLYVGNVNHCLGCLFSFFGAFLVKVIPPLEDALILSTR